MSARLRGRCASEFRRLVEEEGASPAEVFRQWHRESEQRSLAQMRNAIVGQLNAISLSNREQKRHIHRENVDGQNANKALDQAVLKIMGMLELITAA